MSDDFRGAARPPRPPQFASLTRKIDAFSRSAAHRYFALILAVSLAVVWSCTSGDQLLGEGPGGGADAGLFGDGGSNEDGSGTGNGPGSAGGSSIGPGARTDGGPSGGDGSPSLTSPDGAPLIDPSAAGDLVIEPATATVTITAKGKSETVNFDAKLGAGGSTVDAAWTLSIYDAGEIDKTGLFSTSGIIGGKIKVTAQRGDQTATADLEVIVDISEAVDTGVDPGNETALKKPGTDPSAEPSKVLYPYDGTMMPRGLVAPVVQFSAGTIPPVDGSLTLKHKYFNWTGLYHFADPTRPRMQPPQDVWDAALVTAQGEDLQIDVAKAAATAAVGPYSVTLHIAPGKLRGAVYYMTYEGSDKSPPLNGIWKVRPGNTDPAVHVETGCVVCHSLSANGKWLTAASADAPPDPDNGLYRVEPDGTLTKTSGAPAEILATDTSHPMGFAALTPDGTYLLRGTKNFTGGTDTLGFKIDDATGTLTKADVVGLTGLDVRVPIFSPDGKYFAFTNGPEEASPPGTPRGSISVMDVSIDPKTGAAGTLTFSNRRVVLDNGAGAAMAKFITFLPNTELMIHQQASTWGPDWDQFMPTQGPGGCMACSDSKLFLLNQVTKSHIELKVNQGLQANDAIRNYEPFALPAEAAEHEWVMFTSSRQYGNTHLPGEERKQCWLFAVDPKAKEGDDPTYPPIWLPNQTDTKNERCFWSLEPCKPSGEHCETSDDCCGAPCGPSDPESPDSPRICNPPKFECIPHGAPCEFDSDCCDVDKGTQCLRGACGVPTPK